jgi:hypothetical protein
MLDILTQFRAEIDLPQLTDNLRALRLGQRYLCEATSELKRLRKEEKAKSKAETASTAQASQASSSPATACSDANLEGGQGAALPAQPSPATTGPTNAQCLPIPLAALMENVERAELEVEKAKAALEAVERAQLAVEKAKANLAADCAASLAKHGVESSLGMGVRERPLELNVNGPVMRRPADVRRFFDLSRGATSELKDAVAPAEGDPVRSPGRASPAAAPARSPALAGPAVAGAAEPAPAPPQTPPAVTVAEPAV